MVEPSANAVVDDIVAAWQRERPGTPTDGIGIVTRVWHCAQLFGDERRRVLAEAGADPATLDLLGVLRRSGAPYRLSTRDLAARTLVSTAAVSQRVARAERAGLVERAGRADGTRAVDVTLTPDGHALVEDLVDRVLGREADLVAGLGPDRAARLAALLGALIEDLEAAFGRGRPTHVGDGQ